MKLSKKWKIAFVSMLVLALVSTAIAAYLVVRTISNTVRIVAGAGMILIREDTGVEVTSLSWGDFTPLQSKTSEEILGTRITIKNTGNIVLVVGWNATNLDRTRWTLTCTWANNPYPENDFNQFSIAPGYANGLMVFTLTSTDPVHPYGDYGFTLNFNAIEAP